jgi:double-stranded uracil-DNA glycosylase
VQEARAVPGVVDVVVPSPSGLNRMLFDELVEHYRTLAPFVSRADVRASEEAGA